MKKHLMVLAATLFLALPAAFAQGPDEDKKQGPVLEAGKTVGKTAGKAGKAVGKAAGKAGKTTGKAGKVAGTTTGKAGKVAGKATAKGGKATAHGAEVAAKSTVSATKATGGAAAYAFRGKPKYERPGMIRAAQEALQAKGYYKEAIDGIAGPLTRAGLLEFQQAESLKVTGKLNESTAKRLAIE